MTELEQVVGIVFLPFLIVGVVSCARIGWELGGFVWSLFM